VDKNTSAAAAYHKGQQRRTTKGSSGVPQSAAAEYHKVLQSIKGIQFICKEIT